MHSISVLLAFCIILVRDLGAHTLNETLLTNCVYTDITPCLPFIPHSAREQISEMEKAGWLAIDTGHEEQLSYACFLLGGHVPYYYRCLECVSPDPQFQYNDCGPLALQLRSSTWKTVCAFYCPPRESSSRTRDATTAPVLKGPVSTSTSLVLTSAVTTRLSAAASPAFFAPEHITPESERQLHVIDTSRSTRSRRRPEDEHEKQLRPAPAPEAQGHEHDSFMNYEYVALALFIAAVVLLVLLLVLLALLFFYVWRNGYLGRFVTSLSTHMQLRARPQPWGEASEHEMEAGLRELESTEELEQVSTSRCSLASTTPSTATDTSSRALSRHSEHPGCLHAQPQRARDRAMAAQRHNSARRQNKSNSQH